MNLKYVVPCLCLLAVSCVYAAAEDVPTSADEAPVAAQAAEETPEPARSPAPSPTFKPTEEISADSAVSFPVDI